MTLSEFIVRWNNSNRYDFWWRQKHNVAFGSEQHRQADPLDIVFEYFENLMANQTLQDMNDDKERKKLIKSGQWIKVSEEQKQRERELIDNLDLSQL